MFSKLFRFTGLAKLFNVFKRGWEDKLCNLFPAKFIEWELEVVAPSR